MFVFLIKKKKKIIHIPRGSYDNQSPAVSANLDFIEDPQKIENSIKDNPKLILVTSPVLSLVLPIYALIFFLYLMHISIFIHIFALNIHNVDNYQKPFQVKIISLVT